MSLQSWSDYHSWEIQPSLLESVLKVLPAQAAQKLGRAVQAEGDQLWLPREAIEAAALALADTSTAGAIAFLQSVYGLDPGQGRRLLNAIRSIQLRG